MNDREIWSLLADSLGVIGAFFAFGAWVMTTRISKVVRDDKKRKEKLVAIKLKTDSGDTYELPVKLRGDEISRAEVLGRVGMLPIDKDNAIDLGRQPRFAIKSTSEDGFMEHLGKIIESTEDTELVIHCSETEFKQFDFPTNKPNS